MSVTLRIATPEDSDRVLRMIEAAREEVGQTLDTAQMAETLAPLLDGMPLGVVYLVGPPRSPVGYLVLSFGYCLAAGGITAELGEFYIRAAVRRRGMGGETLAALLRALATYEVRRLYVDPPEGHDQIRRICARLRFSEGAGGRLSRKL